MCFPSPVFTLVYVYLWRFVTILLTYGTGIGERRSFPNKPKTDEFQKPDLSVIEINEIGVIYLVSLAVQHFRRLEKNKHGFKGRSV